MAKLDVRQTYGRRQQREAAHQRGAAMGPVMRRVGVMDGAARGRGGYGAQVPAAQPPPQPVPQQPPPVQQPYAYANGESMADRRSSVGAMLSSRPPQRLGSPGTNESLRVGPPRPGSPGPHEAMRVGPPRGVSPDPTGPPPPYAMMAPTSRPVSAQFSHAPPPIRTSSPGVPGTTTAAAGRSPVTNLPPPSVPVFVPSVASTPDTSKPRPSGTYAGTPSRADAQRLPPAPTFRQESGENLDKANKRLSVQPPPRPTPTDPQPRQRPVSAEYQINAKQFSRSGSNLGTSLPSPQIPSIPSETELSASPVDIRALSSAIGRQAQQLRSASPGEAAASRLRPPSRSRSASECLPPDHNLTDTIVKLLPTELWTPSTRTLRVLRVIDELYSSELRYMETLQAVMEVYVRPLITATNGKGVILKEDQIKTIFVSFSALHPFSVDIQQMVRETLGDSTDATLDVRIVKALEDKVCCVCFVA